VKFVQRNDGNVSMLANMAFQKPYQAEKVCTRCEGKLHLIGVLDDEPGESISATLPITQLHDSCSIAVYVCDGCNHSESILSQA